MDFKSQADAIVAAIVKIYSSNNDGKEQQILDILNETKKQCAACINVNLQLKEYMYEQHKSSKDSNDIYSIDEFRTQINDIKDDSLIIYIKKADLFKVYNSKGIDQYCNDSVVYSKPENGPIYEVVRDQYSQKLMIVITELIQPEEIANIKEKIVRFIKSTKQFADSTDDIKIYENENTTEFVFRKIRFLNRQEREDFIENFMDHMKNEGDKELAGKIQLRAPKANVEGARLYAIPEIKKIIESSGSKEILDQLMSASASNRPNIVINIVNNSNNNSTVIKKSKVATVHKYINKKSIKTVTTFCQFIYDTHPEWYLEGEYVKIDVIEEAYRDYFNDYESQRFTISKKLNGFLFDKSKRVNSETYKLLRSYEELKDNL